MGNFYGNISVRGVERGPLVDWLRAEPIPAWVGPSQNGWTVFSDQSTDQMDFQASAEFLPRIVDSPLKLGIAVGVHDDDILMMFAVTAGQVIFSYDSHPNYFSYDTFRAAPSIEGEDALIGALGGGVERPELDQVLLSPAEFVFATELHEAFARCIGAPAYAAGFGFKYACAGELPLEPDQFVRTDT